MSVNIQAESSEATGALSQLIDVIAAGNSEQAYDFMRSLPPGEMTRLLGQLPESQQLSFLSLLSDEQAASLIESLPELQSAQLLSALPTTQAAHILDGMQSNDQTDLLEKLPEEQSEAILDEMQPQEAETVRFLSQYDSESAGGLMATEILAFDTSNTVDGVVADLRTNADQYAEYNVQYIYVTGAAERLLGVLRIRDLLLAPRSARLEELMIKDPIFVRDTATLEELQREFDLRPLFGLPVVNADDQLLGVVRRSDIEHASEQQAGRTFLRFAGILGGEELRSLPLRIRSMRRLSWLSLNVVLNIFAASVIAMYEQTLSQVIALAVFLPIVSDMSGCSGNQAVAVSTRELVLGVIRPGDWLFVFKKELGLGMVNGLALGLLLGTVAWIWKGIPALGLVVGSALALNTVIAVCLGALIPLSLKGLRLDPALASGPVLTTLTDMCGFFLVLSLAGAMLPWLTV